MEKHSGRHRKRRQGWGEHLRWVLGAVLAAVFCSPTGQSTRPMAEARQPLPARRLPQRCRHGVCPKAVNLARAGLRAKCG